MESIEIFKVFAVLGVPGLALGVIFMLFRQFRWEFPKVPRSWVGPIVVLFMFLVAGLMFFALYLWKPTGPSKVGHAEPTSQTPKPAMTVPDTNVASSKEAVRGKPVTSGQEGVRGATPGQKVEPPSLSWLVGFWEGGVVIQGTRHALALRVGDEVHGAFPLQLDIAHGLEPHVFVGKLCGLDSVLPLEPESVRASGGSNSGLSVKALRISQSSSTGIRLVLMGVRSGVREEGEVQCDLSKEEGPNL